MIEKFFGFLITKHNFKIQEFEDTGYALYVKFISEKVGVYFMYEFRDFIPQIQFSILSSQELKVRPGIYTIRELYEDKNYQLKSFYLDEILSYKGKSEYKKYFQEMKTIEDAIQISSGLVKEYATDYITGDELNYSLIDKWLRNQVLNSSLR